MVSCLLAAAGGRRDLACDRFYFNPAQPSGSRRGKSPVGAVVDSPGGGSGQSGLGTPVLGLAGAWRGGAALQPPETPGPASSQRGSWAAAQICRVTVWTAGSSPDPGLPSLPPARCWAGLPQGPRDPAAGLPVGTCRGQGVALATRRPWAPSEGELWLSSAVIPGSVTVTHPAMPNLYSSLFFLSLFGTSDLAGGT